MFFRAAVIAAVLHAAAQCGTAQQPPSPPVSVIPVSQETAETALRADLQEAVTMLSRGDVLLFKFDFLPSEFVAQSMSRFDQDLERAGEGLNRPETVNELTAHFNAAANGRFHFNRNFTLVRVEYSIPERVLIPERTVVVDVDPGRPAQGNTKGLGNNLPQALQQAVDLLNQDRVEDFIRAMYPLGELGRLTQGDAMQREVFRVSRSASMKAAMTRDLEAAIAASGRVSGTTAELPIADAATTGDKPRTVRFELVNGDWRIADANAQQRTLQQELLSQPVPALTVPGMEGNIMLRWDADLQSWRLATMPQVDRR